MNWEWARKKKQGRRKNNWEHLNESSQARNWSFEAGVLRQEAEGKSQKEGARRSVFTNMRCCRIIPHYQSPLPITPN
ncbi:hypothetical protein QUB05_19820 [Microcoleus sp. F10-C6]|uniref:hypothetical protein n=1 Tax=unclassified Microcoleus TaxID=2642155 RepID=UPI002FCF4EB3